MPDQSAFPNIELPRHVADPGMSLHQYATIQFLAAQIAHRGFGDEAEMQADIQTARAYADAATRD